MGSLQLECPLCCSEKFSSHHSLKYHLLSIIDNLICPSCNIRFDKILDLAEHLGRECHEANASAVPPNLKREINVKEESQSDGDVESVLSKSILAKALLGKDKEKDKPNDSSNSNTQAKNEVQVEINDDNRGEEDLFYCSSCAINFTSIEEHLEKYHEGHEVLIEDENDPDSTETSELQDESTQEDMVYIIDEQDNSMLSMANDSEDSQDEEPTEVQGSIIKNEFPQILDTVQQQECFDKDGRVYTRKVVKIEKFWDESAMSSEGGKEAPIIEKYIVINGRARKMEADEELTENTKTILVHKCKHCNMPFTRIDHYYKHKCGATNKDFQFKCTKCSANFQNAKSLCAHMKVHKGQDKDSASKKSGPHICEVCNTDFPTFKSLRLHRRMHDPIKTRAIEAPVSYGITGNEPEEKRDELREMFICQICNKAYDTQYEEAHMNYHKDNNNFDCDICNRKFYTKTNLEMHMRVHNNGKKFTCSYCKKGFLTYENLQEHVDNHCQKRRYECQYCGRRFARPHEKVKHERIHTGEKPHICEICGKAFRVSYCLTLHMRTHSGTRPYQCPHCCKRFKAHSVFNHHLLTHSDVRAYKCPYCPKAFKTGVQLAGHKNSHIKPFTCTECNRPFASLYAVRAHMETHKRENNLKFSCWLCGASYARSFALRDHIKEQHSEDQAAEDAANAIIPEGEETTVLVQLEGEEIEQMETVEATASESVVE